MKAWTDYPFESLGDDLHFAKSIRRKTKELRRKVEVARVAFAASLVLTNDEIELLS
jgi:hypothetical protein